MRDETADFPNSKATEETPKALRVTLQSNTAHSTWVWIPKSMIHDDSEVYDAKDNSSGKLVVKLWWAEKEGLI